MIETPRAALLAGELAGLADFLSFGTNDLTQMTFGFSRDDVGRILEAYLSAGPARPPTRSPPSTRRRGRAGRLAVRAARAARPDISLGVCGEHGGDPGVDRVLPDRRARLRVVLARSGCPSPVWPPAQALASADPL